MNWFNVLKNAGLAQSQRQGFRLDDKDEDYVLEDDDDCFNKLTAYVENAFNRFKPKLELYLSPGDSRLYSIKAYEPIYPDEPLRLRGISPYSKEFGVINDLPDKDYCDLLDALKQMDFENFIHLDKPVFADFESRKVFGKFDMVTRVKKFKSFDSDDKYWEHLDVLMYKRDGDDDIGGYTEQRRVNE